MIWAILFEIATPIELWSALAIRFETAKLNASRGWRIAAWVDGWGRTDKSALALSGFLGRLVVSIGWWYEVWATTENYPGLWGFSSQPRDSAQGMGWANLEFLVRL
jgi:hypothetical protein